MWLSMADFTGRVETVMQSTWIVLEGGRGIAWTLEADTQHGHRKDNYLEYTRLVWTKSDNWIKGP